MIDPSADFKLLLEQLRALMKDERDFMVNAHNFVALLFNGLHDVNWLGFYWLDGGQLKVGPFQGQPACTRIALGDGVCGTAAKNNAITVVPDVHAFPGHIACDPRSRSEIVVPVTAKGRLIGVLDVDSPTPGRFTEQDGAQLQRLLAMLLDGSDQPAPRPLNP